ncbi:hypothetical protein C8R43DRAFT_691997 [Mycena crocata]|nr:hypothetical protein C8R43DRAFT_691997 [Mycena crocata]
MDDIAAKIELADDNKLRGHYIHDRFTLFETSITPAEAPSLISRGRKFYQLSGDLKAESVFIATIVKYYMRQAETNKASLYAGISLDLAEQADDNVCRYHALCAMAMCTEAQGKFRVTLELAQKAQWLATRIGNFQHETIALIDEAAAWIGLGNFSEAVRLCGYARQLVVAAGLEGSQHEIQVLDLEAKVHVQKTAYAEGRRVYEQILRLSTREKFALFHGHSLVSIASIDVDLGMFHSEAELLASLEIPRQIYTARGYLHGLPECDRVLAAFYLADGRIQEAMQMYEKCARSLRGESGDELCLCLLKLGDITLCTSVRSATHWATSYLAYGMTTSSPSDTSWAFRLLADIFRIQGDEKTSRVLFQVALEEFTRMDIHLGKAQCLIRLAELAETRGNHRLAAEHFSDARCMLLKSGYGVVQTEKALGDFNQAHRESLMLEPSLKAPAPSSNVINAMERVVAPM